MGFGRTLVTAVPAAAAGLLLLAPVSATADEGGQHGNHGQTVNFSATGVGGATESTGPGGTPGPGGQPCQFGGTCEVDTNGAATVTAGSYTFPATYSSKLFINYGLVTFPTPTTYCAPAQGTVTITSSVNPADQIFKTESGNVCGGTGAGASHTFTGTYQITGGTGRFHGASGSGTVQGTDNGFGVVTSSQETGTITYPGAHGGGGEGGGGDNGGDNGGGDNGGGGNGGGGHHGGGDGEGGRS